MLSVNRFVATCPKGVEWLLADELRALGMEDVRESRAAATFGGTVADAYRVCLWSRLASRVLMTLAEFPSATGDELYAGASGVAWEEHLDASRTLAVDANGSTSGISHTGFAALKVKDAVVDRIRELVGDRPSVDLERPDVRLNLRLRRERATLSLDLSGEPLNRRGYRADGEQVEAPLKENLAAAILLRAGWPDIAAGGGALLDPMCGSGTLLIEGALMALDRAPGLLRRRWGFLGWSGHDASAWEALLDEADSRAEADSEIRPLIRGFDSDARAVDLARACVRRAGLKGRVDVEVGDVSGFVAPADAIPGLVVTNPPYGVRLGRPGGLEDLYSLLGERLLDRFSGWRAAIFTSEEGLARATGMRSAAAHALYNGAIPAKVYVFDMAPGIRQQPVKSSAQGRASADTPPPAERARPASPGAAAPTAGGAGGEMLANRLRKNLRRLGKWVRKEGATCYRVYDADLPEYAVAIDLYVGTGSFEGRRFAHVQEYAPPPSVDPEAASRRLGEALAVIPGVLGIEHDDVVLKVRRRQRGLAQYERQEDRGEYFEVAEGDLRFLVNLRDYLDTGLFLDHRPTRALIRRMAEGKRFLNLFAYTGTATVYAAAGGAASTTTVDMSATYLDWARRNLRLNGYAEGARNRFVRADALQWIDAEVARVDAGEADRYDLIFLDPPTFSNSKRMAQGTLDIQRDHAALLSSVASLLSKDGTLIFSANHRRFTLDEQALPGLRAEDITPETIPEDFARNPKIHRCYRLRSA